MSETVDLERIEPVYISPNKPRGWFLYPDAPNELLHMTGEMKYAKPDDKGLAEVFSVAFRDRLLMVWDKERQSWLLYAMLERDSDEEDTMKPLCQDEAHAIAKAGKLGIAMLGSEADSDTLVFEQGEPIKAEND